jgi:ABC-type sulfate transport system permease component
MVLVLSVSAAYALARLRPPGRALLFTLVLAPLIIPTDVLIVPVFSIFKALGLINSLPGLALFDVVGTVSFATVILSGFFRTIPQDVIDAARVDGAGRVEVLSVQSRHSARIVSITRSAWALTFAARTGVRMTRIPSERGTVSNGPLNFASRSRMRNRMAGEPPYRGPARGSGPAG